MSSVVPFIVTVCAALSMFSYLIPRGECCGAFGNPIGNMTPEHAVLVGEDLVINCYLFENTYFIHQYNKTVYVNSSLLFFKFKRTVRKEVTIIDEHTLQLRIRNASENYSGRYFCFLNVPQANVELICTEHYNVGYPPLPAENFTCRSFYLQRLKCSWVAPHNPVETNYSLYDNINGKNTCYWNKNYDRPCIKQKNASIYSCEWTVFSAPLYGVQREKLCFRLVSENSLGEAEQRISIDHYTIVVPDKPLKLAIDSHTRDSFKASWLPPKYTGRADQFPPGLIYEVQYKPQYSNSWQVKKLNNETHLNVTSLIPFTIYELQLRCRSAVAEGDDMWSEIAADSVRTDSDVPYLAPEVSPGLFETRKYARDSRRNITIYWKGVSWKYWNGEGFKYIITYSESPLWRKRRSEPPAVIRSSNESFAVFPEFELHTSYEFVLYSANNDGRSENTSRIKVPRIEDAPQHPKDIKVIYHKGQYNVSWENPYEEKDNVVSYTVFWCKMVEFSPCKGPIKWLSVPAEKKAIIINIDDESLYQFGVSSNSQTISSGLRWAPCVVPRDGVLNKVNTLELEPLDPFSIKVIWNLDCPVRKHLVQEYRISYCTVRDGTKCLDEIKNITITNKQATSHILKDLRPYTNYKVVVLAITKSGSSEESDSKFCRTKPGAPSDPPQNLTVERRTNTTIEIQWLPPLETHGIIESYTVNIMTDDVETQRPKKVYPTRQKLFAKFEKLTPYTTYTLQVLACVQYYCSPPNSINVTTEVGVPGSMEGPVPRLQNETFVQVSWIPPLEPNGPIDFYTLYIEWESDDEVQTNAVNVSGASYYNLSVTCPDNEKVMLYFFSIQAANNKNGGILYGNRSTAVQSRLCFSNKGMELGLIIGITVGGSVVLAIIIVALYFVIRWMKKEVDLIKDTEIHLPSGLQTPHRDPSYESFKNGLRKPNDSNLSPKTFYGRLNSYASDESDPRDRTDPGMAPFGNNSREELLHNAKDKPEGKSNNGNTNIGKGNDSISSSLTTRTQLSSDSGTETDVQAPPSPESDNIPLCPPHSSPQPNKSSLPKVNEGHSCDSKDSGLEKEEGGSEKGDISDPRQYSKFIRYLDNPSHPYNRRQASDKAAPASQQLPYSKFGVNMPGVSGYVPLSTTLALMPRQLANSEPSVIDAETVSKDNPNPVNAAAAPAPPYSKYGIGRSLGQALNMPSSNEADNLGTGYSKCGMGPDMSWLQQPKSPYIAANVASMFLGNNMLKQNKQLSPVPNGIDLAEKSKNPASHLPAAPFCPPARNNGYVTVDSMNKPSNFFPTQPMNGPTCLPQEQNRAPHSKGYVSVQDVNKMLNDDRKLSKTSETKDQATGIPGYSKFDIQCDRLQSKPDIQMLDPVLTGTKPKAYSSGYVPCSNSPFDISSTNTPFSSNGSYPMNGSINGELLSAAPELNLDGENSDYEFDTDDHLPSKYLPQSKAAKSPSELNNGYVRVKADSPVDSIRIVPTDSQLHASLTDTPV